MRVRERCKKCCKKTRHDVVDMDRFEEGILVQLKCRLCETKKYKTVSLKYGTSQWVKVSRGT